jgi:hypothetical protein
VIEVSLSHRQSLDFVDVCDYKVIERLTRDSTQVTTNNEAERASPADGSTTDVSRDRSLLERKTQRNKNTLSTMVRLLPLDELLLATLRKRGRLNLF